MNKLLIKTQTNFSVFQKKPVQTSLTCAKNPTALAKMRRLRPFGGGASNFRAPTSSQSRKKKKEIIYIFFNKFYLLIEK